MITIQLTKEEVDYLRELLSSSAYYAHDLDELNKHHPGDIVDWGKQLTTTGQLLLKLREAEHGTDKKKSK